MKNVFAIAILAAATTYMAQRCEADGDLETSRRVAPALALLSGQELVVAYRPSQADPPGERSSLVEAYDIGRGTTLWSVPALDYLYSSQWHQSRTGYRGQSRLVFGGTVRTDDGGPLSRLVYTLDTQSGHLSSWWVTGGQIAGNLQVWPLPGHRALAFSQGGAAAFEVATGERVYDLPLSEVARPPVGHDTIMVSTSPGGALVFDPRDGRHRWLDGFASPRVHSDGRLYGYMAYPAVEEQRGIVALDDLTVGPVHVGPGPGQPIRTAYDSEHKWMLYQDTVVLIGSEYVPGNGRSTSLERRSLRDGQQLWAVEVPPSTSPPTTSRLQDYAPQHRAWTTSSSRFVPLTFEKRPRGAFTVLIDLDTGERLWTSRDDLHGCKGCDLEFLRQGNRFIATVNSPTKGPVSLVVDGRTGDLSVWQLRMKGPTEQVLPSSLTWPATRPWRFDGARAVHTSEGHVVVVDVARGEVVFNRSPNRVELVELPLSVLD